MILPGIFDIYCGLNVLNGGSQHTFNPKLLIHLKCHLLQYSYLSINQSDKEEKGSNEGRMCSSMTAQLFFRWSTAPPAARMSSRPSPPQHSGPFVR